MRGATFPFQILLWDRENRGMRILLIGERYSENLGDPVICETVGNIIGECIKDVEVEMFDISGRTNYNEYYKNQNLFEGLFWGRYESHLKNDEPLLYKEYINNLERYKRTIGLFKNKCRKRKYDFAIFAGGALFMDYFSGLIYFLVKELHRKKCPIIFHACGMGELSDRSITLLQQTFSNSLVKAISLRDSFFRFTTLFKVDCLLQETYDTALACSRYYDKSKKKIAEIGIGIINVNEYYEEQKKLISGFLNSDYSWKIFTNGAPWDYNMACSILKDLGVNDSDISEYLVDRPLTPQRLVKDITSFNQIVSYRMHSQIIAFSFLMPCYSFVWDNKVKTLFYKMNKGQYCFYPYQIEECFEALKRSKIEYYNLEKDLSYASEHSVQILNDEISIVTQ